MRDTMIPNHNVIPAEGCPWLHTVLYTKARWPEALGTETLKSLPLALGSLKRSINDITTTWGMDKMHG